MNPERLLQHFDRISEAPDAIPRLRQFILDLAVRGKLVEQDPNDEPAAELLKRIQEGKEKLRREGLITGDKPSLIVLSTELPFPIPSSWQCARFIDYATDISTGPFGSILHQSDYVKGGVPLVNPSHMVNGRIVPEQSVTVSSEIGKRLSAYKLHAGDIVMARRGEVGRAAIVYGKEDGWLCGTGSFFLQFAEEVCREYLMVLLRCEFVRKYLAGEAVGITMVNLNHGILKRMPLPIPPLAEQYRIVAKVDELMALCDQLEVAKTEREQSRDRLVAASLHRLNQPADAEEANTPEAFRDHARFYFNHLPRLTTRPEHIKQLRQTILNLAVRGKLVPQNYGDASPSERVRIVARKRESLVSKRELRRVELVPPLSEKRPFEIPKNWDWIFPDQISALLNNALTIGPFGSNLVKSDYKTEGTPLVFVADIRAEFSYPPKHFVPPKKAEELKSHSTTAGDLLITKMGDPPGDTAIYPIDRPRAIITADCIKWTLNDDLVLTRFLYFAFRAPQIAQQITEITKGAAHQKVSLKRLRGINIPLPPLAEQRRIVTKVDELMALCNQLETQLTTTEADSRRLLEAVLHEALAPALEEAA